MQKRQLGRSGISITPFMVGGNVFGWTADEATSFRLLDAFVDAGVNAIDTADVYSRFVPGHKGGESEIVIGKWLKQSGKRDKVVIATKLGMDMGDGKQGLSKKYMMQAVEDSLKRLQTDVIDLYQSHRDDEATPQEETLAAYGELIKQGKVRAIGASNFSAERLKAALDHLFAHQNVGPFIGRQLIQRLVTSNPSPAYVGRVAATFANNGQGVRGDMKAVIRAVLLDDEARNAAGLTNPQFGKLREPVVRVANWLRAFNGKSTSARFLIPSTDNPATQLGQTVLRSPSVFNFFRPGYVAPSSASGRAGLVGPELQITTESSVAGYINYMEGNIQLGIGSNTPRDVQPDYSAEIAIANDAGALVDRIALLLVAGNLSASARSDIVSAVNGIAATSDANRLNRVRLAILLTMASNDYLVQR